MEEETTTSFPTMQPGDHMNGQQFGSAGLAEQQQAFSQQTPRKILPSTSGNGMSGAQYQETLGGEFPVDNAMAASQYATAKFTMGRNA